MDVFIALGSNIHPERNLAEAIRRLGKKTVLVRVSRAWSSPPVGPDGLPMAGPPFLNAAVHVRTDRSLAALKEQLLRPIEASLGRVRSADKFAPRPIDLDIAIYAGQVVDAEIWQMAHLAWPLSELVPGFQNPASGETLAQAAERLSPQANHIRAGDVFCLPGAPG